MRHICLVLTYAASAVFVFAQPAFAANLAATFYVDADATEFPADGSTWCKAFRSFDDALSFAPTGSIIRIANGTYTPSPDGLPEPREATFQITGDLTIEGGYAGCGSAEPDRRDVLAFPTILSGDIEGDDPASPPDDSKAVGTTSDNAFHVLTCVTPGDTSLLDGLKIVNGRADACEGQKACEDLGELGGGFFAREAHPTLVDCEFSNNVANRGGAIYADGSAVVSLTRCVFRDNEAIGEGGAIFNHSADVRLESCLFFGNVSSSDGGAVFSDLSNVSSINCTFVQNSTGGRGGGFYNYVGVELLLTNTILWANSDATSPTEEAQIYNNPSNIARVNHSCVEGWTGLFEGEGNTGEDPLFVSYPEDLHLTDLSPCRDQGDDSVVTVLLDLDGTPRIQGSMVDMGAYEFADVVGIGEPETSGDPGDSRPLQFAFEQVVSPNPVRSGDTVSLRMSASKGAMVSGEWVVTDAAGRMVRRLVAEGSSSSESATSWGLQDQAGGALIPGIYFVAWVQDGRQVTAKKLVVVP